MSYSFTIRAATKNEALIAADAKFDEVRAAQPCHEIDMAAAATAVRLFTDLLPDPDDKQDVCLSVGGYVSGAWDGQSISALSVANVAVTASLGTKVAG